MRLGNCLDHQKRLLIEMGKRKVAPQPNIEAQTAAYADAMDIHGQGRDRIREVLLSLLN